MWNFVDKRFYSIRIIGMIIYNKMDVTVEKGAIFCNKGVIGLMPTLCPKVEKAMDLIGKRWTGLIIYQLLQGPQRFCEIENSLPISGRLLSERLKDLEKEGIVSRKVFPEVPVRVEYSLTEKGKALEPMMKELQKWSESYITVETDTVHAK